VITFTREQEMTPRENFIDDPHFGPLRLEPKSKPLNALRENRSMGTSAICLRTNDIRVLLSQHIDRGDGEGARNLRESGRMDNAQIMDTTDTELRELDCGSGSSAVNGNAGVIWE
jgi:hypothetical protein